MDKLEEYIKQHKSYFHQEEVPEGHEMRFADKLQQLKEENASDFRTRRINLWQKQLFRVAVVAFLFVGSITVFKVATQENTTEIAQLPAEIQEVEHFYLAKCEKELVHFRTYHSSNSPVDIAKELEGLEKEYQKLKKEMVRQPGNKRIMTALVKNLQLRLQLLEQINRLMNKEEPQTITL